MNQKMVAGLILVLNCGWCGCTIGPAGAQYGRVDSEVHQFRNYHEAYVYIAKCECLPTDDITVSKLAADSTMKVLQIERIGTLDIIEAQYYEGAYDQIRGAQANGRYYVLRENNGKSDLVGILEGNAYRWRKTGKGVSLQAHWHAGGQNSENDWISYPWDGRTFGAIAPVSLPAFYKATSP